MTRIAAISGSWRTGSYSDQLLRETLETLSTITPTVVQHLSPRTLPHYDADLEFAGSESVAEARAIIADSDAVLIVSPEYNGAPPGSLLNALDWLSRPWQDCPMTAKSVLAVAAAPGRGGGRRAAARLRETLDIIGAALVGEVLSVPHVDVLLRERGHDLAVFRHNIEQLTLRVPELDRGRAHSA